MNLEGTYTFDAPRDVVWNSLLDPDILAKVLPGCEKLEQIGENEYSGMIKIRVGPVQGKFQGKVLLADIKEPNSYSMTIDGKGAPGFMKGDGQVTLETQGDSTIMHYTGKAQIGGRIASVGQRLLDSSAKALTRQSLDGLNRQIMARLQAERAANEGAGSAEGRVGAQAAPPLPEVEAPSEMEFAMGVAKDMLEDLVPPERRTTLLAAGLGAIAFLLFLHWWANVIARRTANEIWRQR